jgi:hypothetical protein
MSENNRGKNQKLIVREVKSTSGNNITNLLLSVVILFLIGEHFHMDGEINSLKNEVETLKTEVNKDNAISYRTWQIMGGVTAIVLTVVILIYAGGIDPGGASEGLNSLGDQVSTLFKKSGESISSKFSLLNSDVGKSFESVLENQTKIDARLAEGFQRIANQIANIGNSLPTDTVFKDIPPKGK